MYFLHFVGYLSLQEVLQTSLPWSVPWRLICLISLPGFFFVCVLSLMSGFKEWSWVKVWRVGEENTLRICSFPSLLWPCHLKQARSHLFSAYHCLLHLWEKGKGNSCCMTPLSNPSSSRRTFHHSFLMETLPDALLGLWWSPLQVLLRLGLHSMLVLLTLPTPIQAGHCRTSLQLWRETNWMVAS